MIQPADLLPTGIVILLALIIGPCTAPDDEAMCPAGTDGPQFACWLREHPEQLAPDVEPWDGGQPLVSQHSPPGG